MNWFLAWPASFQLWAVIWFLFAVVSVGCRDGGLMLIPSFGMGIWWVLKHV